MSTRAISRLIAFGGVMLLTGTAIGIALHVGGGPVSPDCGQQDSAMLQDGDVPSLIFVADSTSSTNNPFAPHAPSGSQSLLSAEFMAVKRKGFLAKSVIPAGRTPKEAFRDLEIPLKGSIVAKSGVAPLEVWETTYTFKSSAGSSDLLAAFGATAADAPINGPATSEKEVRELGSLAGVHGVVKVYLSITSADPDVERSVGIAVAMGSRVVQVAVRGGTALDVGLAEQIGARAAARLRGACGAA